MKNMCDATTCKGTSCLNQGKIFKDGGYYCGIHVKLTYECPICMMNVSKNTMDTTICGHKFHIKCLKRWGKTSRTCPLCRELLDKVIGPKYLNFLIYNKFVLQNDPTNVEHYSVYILSLFYMDHYDTCETLMSTPVIWAHKFRNMGS
jgi:hypothetical protein